MQTLATFYRSKEWEQFRRLFIAQSTDPTTGFVLCAYCGQPIVGAYNLVVHHVEPLTDLNCNRAEVALNSENCQCVHFGCHNKLHSRAAAKRGAPKPRRVHIIYGPPLAGKSSWVAENMEPGDLVADIDSIWQALSAQDRYVKPDSLKRTVFAVYNQLLDLIRTRAGAWRTAFVVAGVPRIAERERLMARLDASDALLVDASANECLKRATAAHRPKEWAQYIEEWFERYQPDRD